MLISGPGCGEAGTPVIKINAAFKDTLRICSSPVSGKLEMHPDHPKRWKQASCEFSRPTADASAGRSTRPRFLEYAGTRGVDRPFGAHEHAGALWPPEPGDPFRNRPRRPRERASPTYSSSTHQFDPDSISHVDRSARG